MSSHRSKGDPSMATKVDPLQVPAASQRSRKKISIVPDLFIAPVLLFFAEFLGWPFKYGIYISLFKFDFLRSDKRSFVGFSDYADLFDPTSVSFDDFSNGLSNTGEF